MRARSTTLRRSARQTRIDFKSPIRPVPPRKPPAAALMSGEFLVISGEGQAYGEELAEAWLRETGWRKNHILGDDDAVRPPHGADGATAVWFAQISLSGQWRLVEHIEGSREGLDWYARQLRERPYTYERHLLPHDVEVQELGTGRTRHEILTNHGRLLRRAHERGRRPHQGCDARSAYAGLDGVGPLARSGVTARMERARTDLPEPAREGLVVARRRRVAHAGNGDE